MTFAKRFASLEAQKAGMLAEVQEWPTAMRSMRPRDGGWNALEVLDHLVRTETGICGVVAETMHEPRRIGVRDRLRFVLVERVFLSQRRVKVPESVTKFIWPGEGLELAEITARWDAGRVRLAEVACEASACRGGVFRHPVSGWMSFEQVLRFFSAHMVHHQYQLERIRRAGTRY